jgi:hypothetical protein
MRAAIVTTDDPRVAWDTDRPFLESAFGALGIEASHPYWWDRAVNWDAFDIVIVRSPWDYNERLPEFLTWLEAMKDVARCHNPAPLMRWNLDKHYLGDLADQGVATIATIYASTVEEVATALAGCGGAEAVVKPVVSAGSRLTGRFAVDDDRALALAGAIVADGQSVMVQPFVSSVAEAGETSVVVFDGLASHAFHKGPILASGGGFVDGAYDEKVTPAALTDDLRAAASVAESATRAISTARGWTERRVPLLYARYDFVTLSDGTRALLEAELIEPTFCLWTDAGAPTRFAQAVHRRISRFPGR